MERAGFFESNPTSFSSGISFERQQNENGISRKIMNTIFTKNLELAVEKILATGFTKD